jgi:hypothetical protein
MVMPGDDIRKNVQVRTCLYWLNVVQNFVLGSRVVSTSCT